MGVHVASGGDVGWSSGISSKTASVVYFRRVLIIFIFRAHNWRNRGVSNSYSSSLAKEERLIAGRNATAAAPPSPGPPPPPPSVSGGGIPEVGRSLKVDVLMSVFAAVAATAAPPQ